MAASKSGSKTTEIQLVGQRISNINSIKVIWRQQDYLHQLTYLNLAKNLITSVPVQLFEKCRNLKKLNLFGNRICVLPHNISNLENLNWLNLGSNELTELPNTFGNLVNLVHLDLGGNKLSLSSFPKTFFGLQSLERLYLSDNNIEKIIADFGSLRNLRILAIRSVYREDHKVVRLFANKKNFFNNR
jgi:Leucine-rich repeat (LRR) protein